MMSLANAAWFTLVSVAFLLATIADDGLSFRAGVLAGIAIAFAWTTVVAWGQERKNTTKLQ